MSSLLLALGFGPVQGGLFDWLTGGQQQTIEQKEAQLKEQIDTLFQMGFETNGEATLWDENSVAIEEGRRAVLCVSSLARFDFDSKVPKIPFFRSLIMNLVYRTFYSQYKSPEGVDRICQFAERRRELRSGSTMVSYDEEASSENDDGSRHLRGQNERALRSPTTPAYPGAVSSEYNEWASETLHEFLQNNQDLGKQSGTTSRANIDETVVSVLDPYAFALNDTIDEGLAVTEAIFEVICNVFGMVEIAFDPGDACRIISSSIGLAQTINEAAFTALKYELDFITLHNQYIDSAEIQATRIDVASIVETLPDKARTSPAVDDSTGTGWTSSVSGGWP